MAANGGQKPMRTAAIWFLLLVSFAAADAQRTSRQLPEATPIRVSPLIKGALEHTPSELRALALGGLDRDQQTKLSGVVAALRARELPLALELWTVFSTELTEHARTSGVTPQLLSTIQMVGFTPPGSNAEIAAQNAALLHTALGLPRGSLRSHSSLDPIVQYLLSEAYVSQNEDLARYSGEVSLRGRPIRERLSRGWMIRARVDVRDPEASWQAAKAANARLLAQWGSSDQVERGGITTAEELDEYLQAMEEELEGIGEDAQLANVDLQNCLQKQQQMLQMMSQLSKAMHDTAMGVIRKMGG